MDEYRLLEILFAIDEIDEPFVILTILTRVIDSNELSEILRIANIDNKKERNFYNAIKNFAHAYIAGKPKLEKNSIYDSLKFQKGLNNFENAWNSNYTSILLDDYSNDFMASSKKNR